MRTENIDDAGGIDTLGPFEYPVIYNHVSVSTIILFSLLMVAAWVGGGQHFVRCAESAVNLSASYAQL